MGQLLFISNGGGSSTGGNLQDAYDAGPNGLISLDGTGPVGIDELRFMSNGEITVDSGPISLHTEQDGALNIYTGNGTGLGTQTISVFTGDSDTNSTGDILITTGTSGAAESGDISIFPGVGDSNGGDFTAKSGNGGNNGGSFLLSTGSGSGALTAGDFQVSLADLSGTPTDNVGGFFIDPANNRLTLRSYTVEDPVVPGSLRLHRINKDSEDFQGTDDGLLHFCTEQDGPSTTVGFRAAKSGNYGLVSRIYQRPFTAAEGVTFAVLHNLDCNAPGVFMYNSLTGGIIPLVDVVQDSTNQVTVTIGGAVDGYVTVIGF